MSNTVKNNANRFVWSNGLQNVGDQIISGKTVLPWVLEAGGAPPVFSAFLVPIRESGSMLPQAFISDWVQSYPRRRGLWIAGSLVQAAATAGIGLSMVFTHGTTLGFLMCLFLAILALGRALCSITGKDIQGATIPKGERGIITGRATAIGGVVTMVVGVGLLRVVNLTALVFLAALAWVLAALIFHGIVEPKNAVSGKKVSSRNVVSHDRAFQRFVIVRSLLLVSALSPTFVVIMSHRYSDSLTGLAPFVIASGLSALLGGRISGIWSDRSSKTVLSVGAFIVSVVLVIVIASDALFDRQVNAIVLPAAFFLIALCHTAIRVARKTYVVDMAEGNKRTTYVAVANTAMGVVLLVVGAISGLLSHFGPSVALAFLAACGFLGVYLAKTLPEVSKKTSKS